MFWPFRGLFVLFFFPCLGSLRRVSDLQTRDRLAPQRQAPTLARSLRVTEPIVALPGLLYHSQRFFSTLFFSCPFLEGFCDLVALFEIGPSPEYSAAAPWARMTALS